MTPGDLARIHAAAFVAQGQRAWSETEFVSLLSDASAFLCVAPNRSEGFVLGRAIAGEAEMLTLAVVPEARRAGVGRGLVAAFLREAEARGATEAFLEVGEDNRAALGLYAAAGFVARGRRKGYYATSCGARVDALVLSRPLSSQARW